MKNFHSNLGGFHNKEVRLPKDQQEKMYKRSQDIRNRLRGSLKKLNRSMQVEFRVQGSYAMSTMVCDSKHNYDVDFGVYFLSKQLMDSRNKNFTPSKAKYMVCDALNDSNFGLRAKVHNKCVQVKYESDYHVDIPVYRRVQNDGRKCFELASENDWEPSNAKFVTRWFLDERRDSDDLKQILRIVRLIKKFAKSKDEWKKSTLSGIGITVLVVECYECCMDRVDIAFYETIKKIYERLNKCYLIKHPTTPNTFIAGHDNKTKENVKFFHDCIKYALLKLEKLEDQSCSRDKGLTIWDSVFNTKYFIKPEHRKVS